MPGGVVLILKLGGGGMRGQIGAELLQISFWTYLKAERQRFVDSWIAKGNSEQRDSPIINSLFKRRRLLLAFEKPWTGTGDQ
jgi:hypothetical protein